MDEVFNPSLLISLGPSASKALEFSKQLLSSIPEHFQRVIEYYEVQDIKEISKDIQSIVDTKLLAAKNLNKLLDFGYKVRSENITSVKINLYLLWDVYNSELSAYEVINCLSKLNYGNIDKNQHSGVCLFIIPILEKEWLLEESGNTRAAKMLKKVIEYISNKENMLGLDSKAYILHCVANDGTRIPREELEYISALIVYLNVLPSKDPPLSHFNKRLLMHEGEYKVGTIGITSLTVFKDRLLEEFSKYLSADILKHAAEYESGISFENYKVFSLLNYEREKKLLVNGLNVTEEEGNFKLGDSGRFDIKLPKDKSSYPAVFKNWEEYIGNRCLTELKEKVDINVQKNTEDIAAIIEGDLKEILAKYSLKDGVNYLNALENKIKEQKPSKKSSINKDTSSLNKELQKYINNCPNLIGFAVKSIILFTFLTYSMINLIFPQFKGLYWPALLVVLLIIFVPLSYLDYQYNFKKLSKFIQKYKDSIFKRSGSLLSLYVEKTIFSGHKNILYFIAEKRAALIRCINNVKEAKSHITPLKAESDEFLGNLITDLLSFEDRHRFYLEKTPYIPQMYTSFSEEVQCFVELSEEDIRNKVFEFSLKASPVFVDLDFYEYLLFKYKENVTQELSKWVDKSVVKAKYLLQYINKSLQEEHSLFITSPEVYKISRDIVSSKLSHSNISIIDGEDIHTNCISIIRLCLGVDFNNITTLRRFLREEEEADG
jgi:hypothetical protein